MRTLFETTLVLSSTSSSRLPIMKKRILSSPLVILLLVLPSFSAGAQGIVEGEVTGPSGETIPGVSVVIADLELGAATGVDGTYRIEEVPTGQHTVEASFVGYETMSEEVTIEDGVTTMVNFQLGESTLEMDQVVVTGTAGNARRREIGTSISQVSAADIEAAPVEDFGDLLQGRAAGVTVMDNSGQVGTGSTIRLRGINSVSQSNTPLVYIDGARVSNESIDGGQSGQSTSPLNNLNPDDIQRIEVVKGPAATTLYGTEASGGVIQVFTKEGAEGATRFNLTIRQGANSMGNVGTQDYHSELLLNNCTGEPDCPADGNWFRTGHTQSYSLSARGGGEALSYFVSGKWNGAEGVIAPQRTSGYSARVNAGFSPFENLSVDFKNSYARSTTRLVASGNNGNGIMINVLRGEAGYTPGNRDALALDLDSNNEIDHFTSGLTFNWVPSSNLLNKLSIGLDYVSFEQTDEQPFGFFATPLGQRDNDSSVRKQLTLDYSGSYSQDFLSSFSSTTSWGGQFYQNSTAALTAAGYDFAGPGSKDIDSGARTTAEETQLTITSGGFYGQERLGWNDQLFLTLGMRVDGFSTFGENAGLSAYPKVSVSYLISEHDFWPAWWESLKLRGAYGESGKAPGAFDALRTYASVAGDDAQPAVTPGNVGDPDLGPERSHEFEAGFEGTLLGGRLAGSFTWYRQRTYDALLSVQPVPSEGFTDSQLRNVGTLANDGLEANLDLAVLRSEAVRLNLGTNYSFSESEAVDLGDIQTIQLGRYNEVREGYPVPGFFMDVVTNPNEVGAAPEMEERYLGSPYPNHILGLNASLTLWEDLTFDVLGEGQFGHDLSSGTAYQQVRRQEWPSCFGIQEQISSGNASSLTAGDLARCDPNQTTYGMWVAAGDFFKIRSASVSYELPEAWMPRRVNNVTLRLQGRNLFVATSYPGLGPEAFESGDVLYRQEYYNLPAPRSFTFALQAGF